MTDSGHPASADGLSSDDGAASVSTLRASIPNAYDRTYTPSWAWRHQLISALLDLQEGENATRSEWEPSIKREMVERAISQLLGAFDCRAGSTASAYAHTGLWEALGIDWKQGIPFAKAIEARSGETERLDPKGESAVAESHLPDSSMDKGPEHG